MSNQDAHSEEVSKQKCRLRYSPAYEIYAEAKDFMNSPRAAKSIKNPVSLAALSLDELPLTPKGRAALTVNNRRKFFETNDRPLPNQEEPQENDSKEELPTRAPLSRSVSIDIECLAKKSNPRIKALTPRAPDSPKFASPRSARRHLFKPFKLERSTSSSPSARQFHESNNGNGFALHRSAENIKLKSPILPKPELVRHNSGRELRLKRVRQASSVDGNAIFPGMTPHAPSESNRYIDSGHDDAPEEESKDSKETLRYQFSLWKNVPKREVSSNALLVFCSTESNQRQHEGSIEQHNEGEEKPLSIRQEIGFDLGAASPVQLQQSSSPVSLRGRTYQDDAFKQFYQPPPFKWKRGEPIGEGTFGKVFMGLNNVTGELFAVKQIEIPWDRNGSKRLRLSKLEEEILLMKDLDHKHIVRYYGTDRNDDSFFIFMEYVPGGSIAR